VLTFLHTTRARATTEGEEENDEKERTDGTLSQIPAFLGANGGITISSN
jgi:hypothetical protein